MRILFVSLLLMFFVSCKKNKEAPPCKITSVTRSGTVLPVTYQGDSVMIWGQNSYGASMYFNAAGKLQRIEEPVTGPYIRTEIVYDAGGRVSARVSFFKIGNDWVYQNKMLFNYKDGKLESIKAGDDFTDESRIYSFDISWQGDNISSVAISVGGVFSCIKRFNYDLTKPNPITSSSYLYLSDGDADYAGYKLPYYFSKNLLTKAFEACPGSNTVLFSYTFNKNGLVETVRDNDNLRWAYEYDCN